MNFATRNKQNFNITDVFEKTNEIVESEKNLKLKSKKIDNERIKIDFESKILAKETQIDEIAISAKSYMNESKTKYQEETKLFIKKKDLEERPLLLFIDFI